MPQTYGFEQTRERRIPELGAVLHEYTHAKSGARLCWLERADENKSFCSNPQMKKSTVRIVDSIEIVRRKDLLYFNYHGTGFLQNMVRILTGTLLEVGQGKRTPESVKAALEAKDRTQAGYTAPPQGLCLMRVDY